MKAKVFLCVLAVALFISTQVQAAGFMGIGDIPDYVIHSRANDISADGTVVVGTGTCYEDSGGGYCIEAFRWSAIRLGFFVRFNMEGLGHLYSIDDPISRSNAVSGDGRVVVGQSTRSYWFPIDDVYEDSEEAFRWTQEGGMESIGCLESPSGPPYNVYSEAFDASYDGDVVVGSSTYDGGTWEQRHAFRWTPTDGMSDMGTLRGYESSAAYGISGDGGTTVGISWVGDTLSRASDIQACYWNEDGKVIGLGFLRRHTGSEAIAVSEDGGIIVGSSWNPFRTQAFRWTETDGMVGLGDLRGGAFNSKANGVSEDGRVIVGAGSNDEGRRAVIWINGKIYHLKTYLIETFGVRNLDDWQLLEATAVSQDGKTISGYGYNPDGSFEGWIANIAKNKPIRHLSAERSALP